MYTVYKHTSPSNKVYIGITCQKPEYRWKNGKGYACSSHFNSAIQKYGWDNIKHEILFENLTKEEACAKEIELIAKYKSNNGKYGYNITAGGEFHDVAEETKQKMSEAQKGEKNHMYGKHHNKETKQKMSESHKGKVSSTRQKVINLDTGVIYDSLTATEYDASNISKCCKGKLRIAYGYHWAYYNGKNEEKNKEKIAV